MADQNPNLRSLRLKVPPRATTTTAAAATPGTSRPYPPPQFPYTPTASATPSKHRPTSHRGKTSLPFLVVLLFSLRSLYSLLPFLRSSPPSFSLFPFSFLVSLLSFLLAYGFSLLASLSSSSSSSSRDPFHSKQSPKIFSLASVTPSERGVLLARSVLQAVVFLLRFQALRYCGTAAMILAELSGSVAARFVLSKGQSRGSVGGRYGFFTSKVRGFVALFAGLVLLSVSWDRIECFPFSARFVGKSGFSVIPSESCVRIWPMLLPFVAGFLGCYERDSMNWGTIKHLGKKRVRLISMFFTTVVLFFPAVISMFVFESQVSNFSFVNLVWPLANTVVFGVLLAENFSDDKLVSSKDVQREFLVTFACTLLLELFYFTELSLWGLLICGFMLYIAVLELDPFDSAYIELGMESSEPLGVAIMKPIRHILSERKSRKIALFLMINTGYMVVEFVAGFMSNSLGLISDACHMLFDCAALAIGLYASYISRLPANNQFNYGRGRFEVLSGYVNAVFLVLVGSLIVLESFERILDPQEISTSSLLTVSIGGLLVNVIGLIFFHDEHHHAHGGSGSCLHSHSHSHDHKLSHDQEVCGGKHENHISVAHESCEKSCSDHDEAHGHSRSSHHSGIEKCHDHDHDHQHHEHHIHSRHHHHHDNHDHSSQNDHHPHDHDSHTHLHNNHIHDHHHDSHDHGNRPHNHHHTTQHHHPGHDNHIHQHDSHGHAHQCDSHDHGNGPHNHNHTTHHHGHGNHSHSHSSEAHEVVSQIHGQQESKKHHHHHDHHHHKHIDHNMEGIFLHVLADTLGSVGVVVSTLLIKYKGWLVADPACSIFISVLIVTSVIPLLRNSAEVLLQKVPRAHERDLRKALIEIRKTKGVRGIQNLHIWSFTNTDVVGTLRLHIDAETDKSSMKKQVSDMLSQAGVKDLTLQVESVG